MARENKIKRVLFYLTVISIVLFPFTIDGGDIDNIIMHISTILILGGVTIISFKNCTKKDIEKITGLDIFKNE